MFGKRMQLYPNTTNGTAIGLPPQKDPQNHPNYDPMEPENLWLVEENRLRWEDVRVYVS